MPIREIQRKMRGSCAAIVMVAYASVKRFSSVAMGLLLISVPTSGGNGNGARIQLLALMSIISGDFIR